MYSIPAIRIARLAGLNERIADVGCHWVNLGNMGRSGEYAQYRLSRTLNELERERAEHIKALRELVSNAVQS